MKYNIQNILIRRPKTCHNIMLYDTYIHICYIRKVIGQDANVVKNMSSHNS